ncbi:flagellar biosynthetic protein FliO [Acidovorax sp. SUPP950]|uniref:flagellar biosynthetic protein FliO n=1 Tax=Acidovorax sp. SUPP950 TaxID=511901 RepID=UPI0023D6B271|nr:flagellar biosynthetic protein FliO [Acidovorax sp. SUPP950]GKS74658.1 flagellar biosynthetic protein FliO [Acidovorax sp. SUPP950]
MTLPATIPLRREPEAAASTPGLEAAWMGILVVLALLAAVVWRKIRMRRPVGQAPKATMTRWSDLWARRSDNGLALVSSARLTPSHSVHEVQWQSRRMLIGCAGQSMQLLGEVPAVAPDSTGLSANRGEGSEAP